MDVTLARRALVCAQDLRWLGLTCGFVVLALQATAKLAVVPGSTLMVDASKLKSGCPTRRAVYTTALLPCAVRSTFLTCAYRAADQICSVITAQECWQRCMHFSQSRCPKGCVVLIASHSAQAAVELAVALPSEQAQHMCLNMQSIRDRDIRDELGCFHCPGMNHVHCQDR